MRTIQLNDHTYTYRPARLVNYASERFPHGDPGRRWYIVYYVYDPVGGQLRRRRYWKINFPHLDLLQRKRYAQQCCAQINQQLQKGMVAAPSARRYPRRRHRYRSLLEAFQVVIDAQDPQAHRFRRLKVMHDRFCAFMQARRLDKLPLSEFCQEMAEDFRSHLQETDLAARTINNVMEDINYVIHRLLERQPSLREHLTPHQVKKLPCQRPGHVAFTDEQVQQILDCARSQGREQFALFAEMIYTTLARPGKELRLARIEQIQPQGLYIPAETAKNKRGDFVPLPDSMRERLQAAGVGSAEPSWYIFGSTGRPGPQHRGKNYFYKQFCSVCDMLQIERKVVRYDLYSFKHSGACHLARQGRPLREIQRQCRHSSIEQTAQYLRDLDVAYPELMKY
jgi:integrase